MTENLKYRLTDNTVTRDVTRMTDDTITRSVTLRQIEAVRDFETYYGWKIRAGELGGWIEHEGNLSQEGNCWIDETSDVFGSARILENAVVQSRSVIRDFATVYDDAMIIRSTVKDHAIVGGTSTVEVSTISDYAKVTTAGRVLRGTVSDHARIWGHAGVYIGTVSGFACILDSADVVNRATVSGHARVTGNIRVSADTNVTPVIITGFPYDVVVTDGHVTIGCQCHPFNFWTEGMFLSRNKGYRLLRENSVIHKTAKDMIHALKRVIALHDANVRAHSAAQAAATL